MQKKKTPDLKPFLLSKKLVEISKKENTGLNTFLNSLELDFLELFAVYDSTPEELKNGISLDYANQEWLISEDIVYCALRIKSLHENNLTVEFDEDKLEEYINVFRFMLNTQILKLKGILDGFEFQINNWDLLGKVNCTMNKEAHKDLTAIIKQDPQFYGFTKEDVERAESIQE